MELQKLAETVLLQLECFYLVQEIDERWRRDESSTRELLAEIYEHRSIKFDNIHPLLRLTTSLSTAFIPIIFTLNSTPDELETITHGISSGKYKISYYEGEAECLVEAKKFLLVFRNSIAHLPDFISGKEPPNISFDKAGEYVLCCRSRQTKLIFKSEQGFAYFLDDLFKVIKATAGRILRS